MGRGTQENVSNVECSPLAVFNCEFVVLKTKHHALDLNIVVRQQEDVSELSLKVCGHWEQPHQPCQR